MGSVTKKKELQKPKGPTPEKRLKIEWGSPDRSGNKRFPLHVGQSKIMRSEARFTAAIAGTGGGKTVLGPLWFMKRIKTLLKQGITTGMVGMVIAPTYKILSRATTPTLADTFRGTEFEGRLLESKGQYILPNNWGILYLLSADSPEGLEGGQLNLGAWLDEAGQMSRKAWQALCRRTGVNQAPVLITTTPYLTNWLKREVLDEFLKGNKNYFAAVWASIINPAYPIEEFERAKAALAPAVFDMMYRGMFTSLEGLVYPDFPSCIIEPLAEVPIGRRVGAIDFGWRAPFCALGATLFSHEGKDMLYLHYERYLAKCRLKIHAKHMPKGHIWFADPSEPEMIIDLKDYGHRTYPANNSINAGILSVNERILTGRLWVSTECVNTIMEAGFYQYPPEEEETLPIDELNHAMDPLRYLCYALSVPKPRISKPRKVLIRSNA